jgi:death-on-curing protein
MIYLTATEITAVHHRVLERTGQDDRGIQYPAGLSLVVNQPQMVVFGHELYPTVWLKAAYIMQKITKKHIFVDGNKRTAYIATLLFLRKNAWLLRLTADEGEALILQVTLADDSEDEMKIIAHLLEKKCQRVTD